MQGSGKTLAFGIPIIAGLLNAKSEKTDDSVSGPKALILTPTRELALQIKQHLNAILKYTDIKVRIFILSHPHRHGTRTDLISLQVASVVGGLSVQKQQRLLKKQPEILIATPGRLWALIQEVILFVLGFLYKNRFDYRNSITSKIYINLCDIWPSMKPIGWSRRVISRSYHPFWIA